MQHHTHGHVYRKHKEADRIIAHFGNKPPEQVKQQIRESLVKEKDRFLTMEQTRTRQQQPQRSRGR